MVGVRRRAGRWLAPRLRVVGGAAALGAALGGAGVVVLAVVAGDARFAASQVFALGALALGFGLLGWSGSAMAGRGVENLQRHLDTGTDWTEADSRRAMARIGGFGAGWMVGAAVVGALLGG